MDTDSFIQVESYGTTVNTLRVAIGDFRVYFSYQTPVAFRAPGYGLVVSENVWSQTTGKHLAMISHDRVKHAEFKRLYNKAVKENIRLPEDVIRKAMMAIVAEQ